MAAVLFVLTGCGLAGADGPPRYQGVLELDEVTLAFDVPGRILGIAVEEGAPISAGQEIATLDDSSARAARDTRAAEVRAAEAELTLMRAGSRREDIRATEALIKASESSLKNAERNVGRIKDMQRQGAATDAQLDDAEAQLEQVRGERRRLGEQLVAQRRGARPEELAAAEARVEVARKALAAEEVRLAHFRLTAPRAGRILERLAEPGEVAGAGTPVVLLADPARPFVEVFVPQQDLAGIAVGTPARVVTDAHPEPIEGRVELVGRTTEFTPRYLFSERERVHLVVRVKVRIDGGGEALTAGVPAFVTLVRK